MRSWKDSAWVERSVGVVVPVASLASSVSAASARVTPPDVAMVVLAAGV